MNTPSAFIASILIIMSLVFLANHVYKGALQTHTTATWFMWSVQGILFIFRDIEQQEKQYVAMLLTGGAIMLLCVHIIYGTWTWKTREISSAIAAGIFFNVWWFFAPSAYTTVALTCSLLCAGLPLLLEERRNSSAACAGAFILLTFGIAVVVVSIKPWSLLNSLPGIAGFVYFTHLSYLALKNEPNVFDSYDDHA